MLRPLHLLLLIPLLGCTGVPTASDRLDLQQAWSEAQAEAEAAAADEAAAVQAGDPEAAAEAQARREAAEAAQDAVADQVLRERGGAIGGLITAFTGPAGAPLGAALAGLAPLARRRSRRKYIRALQSVNPFGGSSTDPTVPKPLAPGEALVSLVDSFRELLTPGDPPDETTAS